MFRVCKTDDDQQIAPIVGHPNYFVGSDGRVYSCAPLNGRGAPLPFSSKRELLIQHTPKGYCTIMVDRKTVAVHSLVLNHFVGSPKEGQQCRHLNGNKDDNAMGNLAWGSGLDQHNDRVRHGTALMGVRHPQAVLDQIKVCLVRRLRARKWSLREIAKALGVSTTPIRHVFNGGYAHV